MAENFKILIHRNDDNLHLKLVGDFDGSSAHQLLNQLMKYSPKFSTTFINTDCLGNLIPFGLSVFKNNLNPLKKRRFHLIFTGDNAAQFTA
ncbi:MAG: hypothetical protein JRI80_18435 [Deltaproteobacteria bacterium]|nr:hypothetical protein [Deltaproteobacteria bacterium]